jgi:peptidylprolyl isomerase
MNALRGISLSILAAAALPLAAQTGHPVHHAAAGAAHREAGGCVTAPELSPTIPALPAGATCVKKLYTLTRTPTLKLDYASPLLSPAVRGELGEGPETFSLEYVDTKEGTGARIEAHQCVSVQYTGWLTDGKKFDSSHDHPGDKPIEFLYGGHHVIPGWDTGFEGMHVGGQRRLFIPYELAYGESGRGPIPAKAELVFDVEAVGEAAPRPGVPPGAECAPAPPPRPQMPPPGGTPKPQ